MALGYLHQILDEFEEGRGWSEVEVSEDDNDLSEGWSTREMEVRNNATEFVITKEADVELTKDVAIANLFTYVRHVLKCFEDTDLKRRYPAFFDSFVNDIMHCPEPKKGCLKWKRFLKYMRFPLALKVPLVRSTLITEFYRVLSLQLMLAPDKYIILTKTGKIKDWRNLVKSEKPFSHVYRFKLYFGNWEDSHWHMLQFTRHFLQHCHEYLKTMRFLHDIGIAELMVARCLEYFIADAIRTTVMEYGVGQMFSSAWGHFEASNSTTMPLQHILQDNTSLSINSAPEPIDKLVIRIPSKKFGVHKSRANLELTISSQKRVLHLVDIKKYLLETTNFQVEELGDDFISEDSIVIMMIVNAEGRKLAVQSPFCVEYNTIVQQLHALLEEADPK